MKEEEETKEEKADKNNKFRKGMHTELPEGKAPTCPVIHRRQDEWKLFKSHRVRILKSQ